MRVENNNPVVALQVVRGKRTEETVEVTSGDRASISRRASDLAVAFEALRATPEVRDEVIQELKAQIDEGTFVVDEKAVAAKLLDRK